MEGSGRLQLPADDHLPEVDAGAEALHRLSRQRRRARSRCVAVGAFWILLFRTYAGFQLQVGGLAPAAARYAGFSSRKALWIALLLSGGMAGLAGGLEVAGPLGQLTPHVPAGYGFAAIIVAFVGRLHPVGIVFSAILMSMFYIGGELAQSRLGLPKSLTGVFQGLLLFTLLACDTLIAYRVRWKPPRSVERHGERAPIDDAPLDPSSRHDAAGSRGHLMDQFALLVAATLNAGTVLAFAALGLLINERAGIVNLGAEGMMLVAAVAGFATAVHTGNDWLAFGAGAARRRAARGGVRRARDLAQHQPVRDRPRAQPVRRRLLGLRRHPLHAGKARRAATASRSPASPTCRSSARRCSASIRWSTSRSR